MTRTRFLLGDVVNYHSVIGGPVTSTGHVVMAIQLAPSGRDVAWISGKSGCVAVAALSLVSRPDGDS